MITGVHGRYNWLQTDRELRDFLGICPFAVLNKYLAITAVDSGSFAPSDADCANGWTAEGGVAYSPRLQSIDDLPSHSCCRGCYGFDEWYIFDKRPVALGTLSHANPFTTEIALGNVVVFVNFGGFSLSDPVMGEVTNLFWRQVDWMQPHSYLADGQEHLIFTTKDAALFAAVENSLHSAE